MFSCVVKVKNFKGDYKMNKLCAIILASVLLFALAVPTVAILMSGGYVDPDTGEFVDGEIIVDNPYAALWVEFFEDGKYPDDFAGVWVENGGATYVFALVEGTDSSKYEAVLEGYAGRYRFVYMPYSYNTLSHMRDVVFERLNEIMSTAGVHQDENKIHFEVGVSEEEENGRIAQAMLDVKNEENLPDGIENAFRIDYGVGFVILDDLVKEETDEETPGNPGTGVIYATLPMAAAAAAMAVCRKKQ